MDIGQRIRDARKNKGLTQKDLGNLINKSSQVISNWERAYTPTISHEDIVLISDALQIPASDLIENKQENSHIQGEQKKPKDLQKILAEHELLFSGTPLDEEDKEEIYNLIQYRLYKRAKELNKRKPTPKGE
ncbi:MAG: helix-turn-helix transcriptional regulator [Sporomusaceae bacterium]|nr:helix-turn-helix transcriptional regulator [Sporomusaceae bacterium]